MNQKNIFKIVFSFATILFAQGSFAQIPKKILTEVKKTMQINSLSIKGTYFFSSQIIKADELKMSSGAELQLVDCSIPYLIISAKYLKIKDLENDSSVRTSNTADSVIQSNLSKDAKARNTDAKNNGFDIYLVVDSVIGSDKALSNCNLKFRLSEKKQSDKGDHSVMEPARLNSQLRNLYLVGNKQTTRKLSLINFWFNTTDKSKLVAYTNNGNEGADGLDGKPGEDGKSGQNAIGGKGGAGGKGGKGGPSSSRNVIKERSKLSEDKGGNLSNSIVIINQSVARLF